MEQNNGAKDKELAPFAHEHRAKHLAAELEAQRKRDPLRHGKPCMRLFSDQPDNALHAGNEEDDRSRCLQQKDPELHKDL